MPNYNETTTTGTMWTRCNQIIIDNPYAALQKSCRFLEENVVHIGDNIVNSQRGFMRKVFNPNEVITIRDPVTGEPTGQTATHQELYNLLYSLYMQSALERDSNNQ